jgi:hypothetical protein
VPDGDARAVAESLLARLVVGVVAAVLDEPRDLDGLMIKKRRHRRLLTFIWLVAAVLLVGCAGPLTQWQAATSLVSKASSFAPSALENERVAVLTAVVGFGSEGYSHQVSRSLGSALEQRKRPIKVLSPYETLSLINEAGLAEEYEELASGYSRSGILHRSLLEKIGRGLDANYVFQPALVMFSQSTSGRLSFFGLRLSQTRISILRLTVQLWETRTGKILWESTGEGTLADEDVRESRIPFDEIAQRLWERMLNDLWK